MRVLVKIYVFCEGFGSVVMVRNGSRVQCGFSSTKNDRIPTIIAPYLNKKSNEKTPKL